MLNKIYKIGFVSAVVASPFFVFAEVLGQTGGILNRIKGIITDTLIPIVFMLALLLFFWGMVKYIWSGGEDKEAGKRIMVWGVVALFVMSSIWGIIRFLQGELIPGANNSSMPIPTIGDEPINGGYSI